MTWTQADIDALKKALAAGALTVRHGEKSVTYRSLAEAKEILELMKAEVNRAPPRRYGKIAFRRGRG